MGLYEKLPDNVDRNLWSYNTAVMTDLRPEIDALTEQYIQTYHKDDFDRLKAILKRQSEVYKTAYGKADGYTDNKVKDLYQRMGNTILAELKDYDREIKKPEESYARQADHAEKESSAAMSKQYRKTRNEITLKLAMRQLRKSLEYDYKNWRNLQEYERLQNEISFGRGEDQTLS